MSEQLGRRIPKQTVKGILANPVYTGQARGPGASNDEGHEAIIDMDLWRVVQKLRGQYHPTQRLDGRTVCPGWRREMRGLR
jgi:hypothetical protein